MMDKKQSKKENLRNYINKDTKQDKTSKNQIVQTIEENAYNESVFESKKKEYHE